MNTVIKSSNLTRDCLNLETASKNPGLTGNADLIKANLIKFFSDEKNMNRLLPIIKRVSPVSLRLLDYFCVNYSKSTQVIYMVDNNYFDVHSSYKVQLKKYSKKLFDPFRRNVRLPIRYENDKFDTTVGQLCFFEWCLSNGIIDYVEKHIGAITEDMKNNYGKCVDVEEEPEVKKRRSSRRRSEMTVVATRVPCPPGQTKVLVTFD